MKYFYFFYFTLFIVFYNVAQYTYVPDDNFEQALIDQGLDDVLDDYVLTANISSLSTLSVADKNIDDLTGIEGFVSISHLHCQYNNLTSLDLSSNNNLIYIYAFHNNLNSINLSNCLNLRYLDVSHNQLSNLDITNNVDLLNLYCYDNLFTNLNVSLNVDLQYFECWENSLTSINLTNNIDLIELYCNTNQITSIDLSNNLDLKRLLCYENPLTSIDLSNNIDLEYLHCYDTQITSIELMNNQYLENLSCGYNDALIHLDLRSGYNINIDYYNSNATPNLTCIFVDDADYSNANWWYKDAASTYVETQTECDELTLNDYEIYNFKVYPNPTHNSFNIQSNSPIEKVYLLNILGKKIKSYPLSKQYSTNDIKPGIYIIQIKSNNTWISKKLIIN